MNDMTKRIKSEFSKLDVTYAESFEILNGLSFDSQYFPHIVAVALLNNCLEIAHAISALSKSSLDGGHPILLRSLFESTARLMFLAKSPEENALILERIGCDELLRQIGKEQSPLESTETIKLRKLISERLEVIRCEKIKKVNFKEILNEIKCASFYPLYQELSAITHGQIIPSLLPILNEQNNVKFDFLKPFSDEKRMIVQELAVTFLQLATLNVQRILI